MKYLPTDLNGWNYVLAITQAQINRGFAMLYQKQQLPNTFERQESMQGMPIAIRGEFGTPALKAIKDGLKLCHMTIPILDLVFEVDGSLYPIDQSSLNLVISTSLANVSSTVEDHDQDDVFEVYIDLKSADAIYKVDIEGNDSEEIKWLEELLELELKTLNASRYLIASVPIPEEAQGYLPQLIDYSFSLDPDGVKEPTFLLCGHREENGPTTDNRLVFDAHILPEQLPAALWIGKEMVMGEVVRDMMTNALHQKHDTGAFAYDGKNRVYLKEKLEMGKLDGDHPTRMDKFDIFPVLGKLRMSIHTTIKEITFMKFTAVGKVSSEIAINLKGGNSFALDSQIVEKDADLAGIPTPLKVILGFLSVGLVPMVLFWSEFIMEKRAEAKVEAQSADTIKEKLEGALRTINTNLDKIPALQELAIDGHVVLDDVSLHDNGNFIFGIKGMHTA